MASALILHAKIDEFIEKYKADEYVYGRLVNYIENLLPAALETASEINKKRQARRITLNANQDEFTTRFLKKNNYFYSSSNELFLFYDGLHFVVRNEDEIYHHILSTISSEKCLLDWRHKVNKYIIKRIKERSPLLVVPESVTIQFVLNTLCPTILKTRNQVKYFLSIIGECLFKKKQWDFNDALENEVPNSIVPNSIVPHQTNPELIYIFPQALKELIREIGNQCYTFFGLPNVFHHIKFKYYDHNYNNCRLISITAKKIEIPPMLSKHMLDFLCVAAHYHLRYGSADNFLHQCNDNGLVEHALLLSKNTPESIVDTFIEKSLTATTATTATASSMNTKNMFFIWKKFLDERNIPNIIFYDTLKTILKKKINYDEVNDCFLGITSIHLPIVSLFMRFWEETITGPNILGESANGESANGESANEMGTNEMGNELELDELCVLFKHWTNNTKTIQENLVLELVQHFYPEVVIENNKYILHKSCKLWNKHEEVLHALQLFKSHCQHEENIHNDTITDENLDSIIYEPYLFYSLQPKNKFNMLVSKRHFEQIISNFILNELDLVFP